MIKVSMRAMNKLGRIDMPARDPLERAACFDEVNTGLTPEQATVEAMRCLQCKTPTCIDGCPVNIQIDQFIERVA
ncbi:MAG: dihydropyrimidine dehydrogenase, partial [Actinomycetota bacterium]|nr:dihydropyrimidine dehydrogenase [Actinomycetota bacterium]